MARDPESYGFPQRRHFGRRKGPALSAHQTKLFETVLPRLLIKPESGRDPRCYFNGDVSQVWLEIGFGGGEHLLWQARSHPDVGIIGAEPYISGVAKLLSKLSPSSSSRSCYPGCASRDSGRPLPPPHAEEKNPPSLSSPVYGGGVREANGLSDVALAKADGGNIRLYPEDAADIIQALPASTLDRLFVLFPDPWPKTRHHKRRFIQTEMLGELARVMKSGAELRFATDDQGYLVWTLERLCAHPAFAWLANSPADWRVPPHDWPETRYEAKAKGAGVACTYLRFLRR
jgi:tRNA (guanine-N7-)-methyltransferase